MSEEEEILALSKQIIYPYYGENNPDYLFSFFAPDIIWLGAGKAMHAEGAENVRHFYEAGRNQMLTCNISDEYYRAMPLGQDYWLCEVSTDIETKPGQGSFLHECQRCTFVYRRNSAHDPGWEIVHLHNSMVYKLLKPAELFAVSVGAQNHELLKKDPSQNQKNEDMAALYNLLEKGIWEPCPPKTKKLLIALSVFAHFSAKQAESISPYEDTALMLSAEKERNSFLYFDAVHGQFRFHPSFRSYLQKLFEQYPTKWKLTIHSRAAKWHLSVGEIHEAIAFARQAQDFDTMLAATNRTSAQTLTPRETKIVELILQGYSNREAAEKMQLAEITIKKSLSHIYAKFGLKNRVALTLFFTGRRCSTD